MHSKTLKLDWGRFALQFSLAVLAIICAFIAGEILLSIPERNWFFVIAIILIILPILAMSMVFRVPYRRDEFERRLRNWSMTQSAVWVLMFAVTINLLHHREDSRPELITTYMMPGLFFLCHALYSQYLRYKIARGEKNAFSDGHDYK